MVVDCKHGPSTNSMKSTGKYSMLHAEARYDRHCCNLLQFHCTTNPNTKFSIFSSECNYNHYYSLDISTDIVPSVKLMEQKTSTKQNIELTHIHEVHNKTPTIITINTLYLRNRKENSWWRRIQTHIKYYTIRLLCVCFEWVGARAWERERRTWGRYKHPQ